MQSISDKVIGRLSRYRTLLHEFLPGDRIRVTVRALPGGTDAEIAIADDGCGMDASSVERAFVPFGSVKDGGTGFGLFIARRVARAIHGGDLSLASRRGEGTTVTMTLPLRHHVAKRRGGARAKSAMGAGKK